MNNFLHSDLWKTIVAEANISTQRSIAVPYVGKGAFELLNLKDKDILVVNMSLPNVINGQVNPFEIEKYYKSGVKLYNCTNLHAKIYLFDDSVIVCSANISNNSYNNLLEAGIHTDDKQIMMDTRSFFEGLFEPITEAYIDYCQPLYNPPKTEKNKDTPPREKVVAETSVFWIINVKPTYLRDEEEGILEKNEKEQKNKLRNRKEYAVWSIRFPTSSNFIKRVREGDMVLQISNEKSKSLVGEPMRVLGISKGIQINDKGHSNMFLVIEDRVDQKHRDWSHFEKYLDKKKIKGITKKTMKEIKEESIKRQLYDYWSSK